MPYICDSCKLNGTLIYISIYIQVKGAGCGCTSIHSKNKYLKWGVSGGQAPPRLGWVFKLGYSYPNIISLMYSKCL